MKLEAQHVRRLERFLDQVARAACPEPSAPVDAEITHRMIDFLLSEHPQVAGARVLVVGSRDGAALDLFVARGLEATGVTWDPRDVEACRSRGLTVQEGDVSFLDFDDASFSVVWCRQVLEHSVIPAFALSEMHRLLAPGGCLYLEVSSPDTSSAHQANRNHYSVLGKSMWLELLRRAGFELLNELDLSFTAAAGPDLYWALVARRPPPPAPTALRSAPARATASVYLALPVGSMHGWGICGKHIAREMAALTSVRLVTDPFTPEQVGGDLDYWELQRLLPGQDEGAALARVESVEVDCPLLVGIGDEAMRPGSKGGRGSRTVGYTFFEKNVLDPEAIEYARAHYDLVATGSTWCTEILRRGGLAAVETVIQGVDPAVFEPSLREREYFRDRFVVFSGGKFELRKGQDLVMRAVRVLQERHADVLLVASWFNMWGTSLETMRQSSYIRFNPPPSGLFASMVLQTLAENGLDPARAVILGPQSNAMMARAYKNSDVGLFPNRCEGGTNLVLMEYMACGKPAIASYNSGHRDILTEGNSLRLEKMKPMPVRAGGREVAVWDDPDLDEMVDKLEWAYQHRERLEAIGGRAGQALSRYTWRATAEKFHHLLTGSALPT